MTPAQAVAADALERAGEVILAEKAGRTSYVSQATFRTFSPFAVRDRHLTLAIDLLMGDRDALRRRHYTCAHGVVRTMPCIDCGDLIHDA